jgi:uncharacterized membrane protein
MWDAILTVHLLAMALFVGGQLFLGIAVVPVERRSPDRERLRAIARRFGWSSLIALALALITGGAMASHYHLWSDGVLDVKLALVGLALIAVVWHMKRPSLHVLEGVILLTSIAIVTLGVVLAH